MILHDNATVSGIRRTAEGYLVADAKVARTGIQLYSGAELGLTDRPIVRVWRPEDEVFADKAMRTFAHRPVTINHPSDLVTADTWKSVAVGQTGDEVIRDGAFVRVPLVLMDAAAIAAVESGTRELSMGYTSQIEFADGVTPDGEPYDAIQRDMRMNHLAIVAKARGGSELKIGDKETDMADAIKTRTVMVDGLPIEVADAAATIIEKLQGDLTAARKQVTDGETAIAKKDAEIDDLKGKVLTDAQIDARAQARADLLGKARAIAATIVTDGKSDAEIRKAAVVAKLGDAAVEGKSDAYVEARFDILVADADPIKGQGKETVKLGDADKAYREATAELTSAWNKKGA
ncbi:MAG: DUF2213 domain-containing protein [Fuscovulum sp.]|nr:MAG: DUF2213 domain-containing protein [Fuscovulum sp.]